MTTGSQDHLERIQQLKSRMRARKKLVPADRPVLARNLGRLIEDHTNGASAQLLVRRLFHEAFSELSVASKLANRKRYVRFEDEPLPRERFEEGEYAAKADDYLQIAEALSKLKGDHPGAAWDTCQRLVAGTSFGPGRRSSLEDPDIDAESELRDACEGIIRELEAQDYFAVMQRMTAAVRFLDRPVCEADREAESPRYVRAPEKGPMDWVWGPADRPVGSFEGVCPDDQWNWPAIPSVFLGHVYFPLPLLSIPIGLKDWIPARVKALPEAFQVAAQTLLASMHGAYAGDDWDSEAGGIPQDDDRWSLLAWDHNSGEWKQEQSFWRTIGENAEAHSLQWRKFWAKYEFHLHLLPVGAAVQLGLSLGPFGGPELSHPNYEKAGTTACDIRCPETVTGMPAFASHNRIRRTRPRCAGILCEPPRPTCSFGTTFPPIRSARMRWTTLQSRSAV